VIDDAADSSGQATPISDAELDESIEVIEGIDGSLTVELEFADWADDDTEELGEDTEELGDGAEELGEETEEMADGSGGADLLVTESEDGRITYDGTPWAAESRTMLSGLLNSQGIAHVWQGTEVTIHESDEDRVDRLIAEVMAAAAPAFDPSAPKIVYEVSGWSAGQQTELADSLLGAGVPFEWNQDGDLVVLSDDEERVEELLDALPEDDADTSANDGIAVHEVLDGLFLAAVRLAKKPTDAKATVQAVNAANSLSAMALSFGFEDSAWNRLVLQAVLLADALRGEGEDVPDDAELGELAGGVRDLVGTYIR